LAIGLERLVTPLFVEFIFVDGEQVLAELDPARLVLFRDLDCLDA